MLLSISGVQVFSESKMPANDVIRIYAEVVTTVTHGRSGSFLVEISGRSVKAGDGIPATQADVMLCHRPCSEIFILPVGIGLSIGLCCTGIDWLIYFRR